MITTDLKEGGADIIVNQSNKREYVDLYADFLLNKYTIRTCVSLLIGLFRSVEKQFLAFQRGFNLVTSESPLQMMFTPHELEMLICGEKEFDFNELENSTEYDGGFSKETNCVRYCITNRVSTTRMKYIPGGSGRQYIPWTWRTRENCYSSPREVTEFL